MSTMHLWRTLPVIVATLGVMLAHYWTDRPLGSSPTVGEVCAKVGERWCRSFERCTGTSYESCMSDFRFDCCLGDDICHRRAATSGDLVQVCLSGIADQGCKSIAAGQRSSYCNGVARPRDDQ